MIRGYTEDSLEQRKGVLPGTVIDVSLPVWRVGEVLYFASRFLDRFEGIQAVLINCQLHRTFRTNHKQPKLASLNQILPLPSR